MSEDVTESFRSSLDDLKMNSKPQISMLTMLAEEDEQYASEIVKVIEDQIKKVPVNRKLPIMYLIDSIIKNLSATPYPQKFAQCIVQIFCGVFEEVDEKTRTSMYKLRQTWPDIIPNKQLYQLDRKVQLIDPAWPVTAKAPEHGVIHVNPKFLKPKEKDESPQFSPVHSDSSLDEGLREELYAKEKELQKLRLELELAETKAKLEQQKKQLEQQTLQKAANKRILDREPPIKLPPANSSSTAKPAPVNRDPRLNREPPVSRDPRLQKQQQRQEKERQDMEKEKNEANASQSSIDVTKMGGLPPGVRTTPVDSLSQSASSSSSTRMDLASLLSSFTNAAAKVAAEHARKKSQSPQSSHLSDEESSEPPFYRNVLENQPKTTAQPIPDLEESTSVERNAAKESLAESKPDSLETEKTKDISSKIRDKELKKDGKNNKSPQKRDKDKQSNKDKERSDGKEMDNRSSKDKDRRDSADKERRDGKESNRSRDRRDRRSDTDVNHHSPRRNYRGRSPPELRRDNYMHGRVRGRDRGRRNDAVIHSRDGRTDQFGRTLRRSKSRSPVSRDTEKAISSPREDTQPESVPEDKPTVEVMKTPVEIVAQNSMEKSDVPISSQVFEVSDKNDSVSDVSKEGPVAKASEAEAPRDDSKESTEVIDMELDQEPSGSKDGDASQTKEVVAESEINSSEDVDMRIQPTSSEVQKEKQDKQSEDRSSTVVDRNDSAPATAKRQFPDTEPRPEMRPYKIPKLTAKKIETKPDKNEEDISNLFGKEDVDYRHLSAAPAPIPPPPVPNENMFNPMASNLKSPAQRRWSQFKESHPDDFAQDMERKRLRDAQMQSMASDAHDVDLRPLTSSRQRPLLMPPLDPSVPIPKDLSPENQEQILQRAEQELKEGRISHGEHQEIIRQLGQVYDIQKKRHILEDRPSRTLDLKDPRLRGIRERPYPQDVDRRVRYYDESASQRKGAPRPFPPVRGDISDESSSHSPRYRDRQDNFHPGYEMNQNEDFDARRMVRPGARHDRRLEYERQRGPPAHDFDGRSPREVEQHSRDYDERVPHRYRDYDARNHRDNDRYNDMPPRDFEERHRRMDEERRDYRGEVLRDPYDEYNSGPKYGQVGRGEMRPHDMRGPPVRDARFDEIRNVRQNTPPPDAPYGSPREDTDTFRPLGPERQPIREPFPSQGPRHGMPQDVHDVRPRAPNPQIRPELRMPAPPEPRLQGPGGPISQGPGLPINQGPAVPINPGPISQSGRISDPMDDPRWSAMRGLLDSEGTEELVIDGKPFELRMGTSRKLRMFGKVMDVAVDLKERGIRIDAQLVYKLGEPIKEVAAVGRVVRLYYHGLPKPIWLDGQQHEMRLDAPPRNVMVDGVRRGFQIDGRDMMILVDRLEKGPYGGPPRKIRIGGADHDIAFQAPPRRILIDNKSCELKLDSKIPYVVIDSKPHGIRFDSEPRTVFINDIPFTIPVDRAEKIKIGNRPTYIAFGGPAHEIIIDGKWFEVKFDNVPKDIHLGNRHFSIRIPGPLPRVKILDELPPNFDVSCLMSSSKTLAPQPSQVETGGGMFIHGAQALEAKPELVQQGQPVLEPAQGSMGQNSDVIHPLAQPGIENIRPNIPLPSEGALRPFGPMGPDAVRFAQTVAQMMPQPNQPMVSQALPQPNQPMVSPALLQPNQLRQSLNQPMLNLPNLIGLASLNQTMQNNRMVQPAANVNLIAQGLLNQVAKSMVNAPGPSLPDLAASLSVLSQIGQIHNQHNMPHRPPVDDHGVAMVTGLQGSPFIGQQKPCLPLMMPKPNLPMMPGAALPQPQALPGFQGAQRMIPPGLATAMTAAPSTTVVPAAVEPAAAANPAIDVNSLLNKLLKAGLIKETPKSDLPADKEPEQQQQPGPAPVTLDAKPEKNTRLTDQKGSSVPDLTDFDSDKMKRVYKVVIEQLHEGVQCHTCAARFTISDHEKYRAHLDWHFRQNKIEQEMVKVAKNRKWFYSIPDWIQYEELEDTLEKSRSEIFESMKVEEDELAGVAKTLSVRALEGKDVIKNPVATGVEGEDVCATCGDPFDQMWNEDTEEWILKNTIKVDGKTYHPVCYEDAQETPTPVAVPAKNPLEVQLEAVSKMEEQDSLVGSSSSSCSVKVEIKAEPMELQQDEPRGGEEAERLLAKPEIKSEIEPQDEMGKNVSSDNDQAPSTNTVAAVGANAGSVTPPQSVSAPETTSCQAPALLSNIITPEVQETIPVAQDDPMSPWEMDSNPTPELSRTPTPDSITPAPSVSSESISSLAQGPDSLISEEPLTQ